MKIYTIEEDCYDELEKWVRKIVDCGSKIVEKMDEGQFGMRGGMRDDKDRMRGREYDRPRYDEDDYDWKIKKGNRYMY